MYDEHCNECKAHLHDRINSVCKKVDTVKKTFTWVISGLAFSGLLLTGYFFGVQTETHNLAVRNNVLLERIDKQMTGDNDYRRR